jgi:DNA-binding MarR family transcriptional regulator
METLLIEFINTLDLSLKKIQAEVGDTAGISKLTIHQLQYIDAIYALGEPNITEIADRLNITKASVTIGVNKLAGMGYTLKTRSTTDKRVFHVSLTPAGKKLVKAKYQVLKEYGEFISAALTREEAGQFEEILTKLVDLIKKA